MTKNQSFTFDTKPSNQIGKGAFSRNLFLRKQTQFPNSENHYNYLQKRYLQRFTPPNQQKKQTQSKPNQSQFSCRSTLHFLPFYSLGPTARPQFRGENFLQEPRIYQHNGKISVRPRFSPLTFLYVGVTLSLIIT